MGPSVKFHSYGRYGSSSSKRGVGSRQSPVARTASSAVVKVFITSQITGRGVKSLRHLPPAVYTRLGTPNLGIIPDLASLCVDLETGLIRHHVEACQRALCSLQHALCDGRQRQQGMMSLEAFVLFGGDVLLRRALSCPFLNEDGVEKKPASNKVLAVRRECLSLLHELCVSVPFFAQGMAENGEFLGQVFGFMYYAVTFDQAVGLVEDVLAAREDTLRVQDIPDFANLVRSFSSRQLASFCRVLAMVTFEPEAANPWMEQDWSAEITFHSMHKPEEQEWTVADRNHDAILLIPDILARLVQLLTFDKVSFSREGLQGTFSPSEFSELTAAVYLEGFSEHGGEGGHDQARIFHSHSQGSTLMDEDLLDWNVFMDRTSPATARLLSHHVEVLFVLCALCGGKKREQVQNDLAELGLVDVLNDMFDKLDWMVSQPHESTAGNHGHGCGCNPKSALKIQYLRLIHNFCDRDSCNRANKQLLLRPRNSKDGSSIWNKNGEQKESEGLIVKILKVLVNEPEESLYRFWLASCVEAFLRGADNKDQEYVASTGLMEHLVNEILKGGFRCAPLLQINFDLLGELIKFNKALFRELNRLLPGTKFDQFVEILVANLVDSNVFVRSVVLSVDYFKRPQQMGAATTSCPLVCSQAERQATLSGDNYKYGSTLSFQAKVEDELCMISAFVSHNTHRLLRDLMCAVRLSDINQDNICVLNTTLIFFILAEKNGELHGYLQALRTSDMHLLQTFRALLEFWRCYYLWKWGRECVSLQYSTQISFSKWLQIVDSLCAPSNFPYSLFYTGAPISAIQCVALSTSSEPLHQQQ